MSKTELRSAEDLIDGSRRTGARSFQPADGEISFHSVLDPSTDAVEAAETLDAPAIFRDLNLDQIVAAIVLGRQDYNLAPFFYRPLRTVEAVEYRQDVMRDLENPARLEAVNAFAAGLRAFRDHIAQAAKMYHNYQRQAWLLDAIELYCKAVERLRSALSASPPRSAGLASFLGFLNSYVASPKFERLTADGATIKAALASIRYNLLVGYGAVSVSAYAGEADYGAEIEADFERFRQGAAHDHVFKSNDFVQMNHIEAGVVDRVALLFPQPFADLEAYLARNADFLDPTIDRFDREVQFYVAYLSYMRRFTDAGLPFCYPRVSALSKAESVAQGYDPALAGTLLDAKQKVVANDYSLYGRERIVIVSGPNQGGKTTFARMFGQLHYLAAIGCPVPAATATLVLFDRLFAHFDREEGIHNLRGKLHDDLARLHETLSEATPSSIIILNEVFNSTSLKDAVFLSTKVLTRIVAIDAICVCVTFIDELASLSDSTVSMASNVKPGDVAQRTFKITRRPPDGLAYAISVAERRRLTYPQLRERLRS